MSLGLNDTLNTFGSIGKTGWKNYCTGVIVSDQAILSAAHCFKDGSHLSVRTGDEILNDPNDDQYADTYTMNTVITHPDYVGGVSYDLAVIFTTEKIKFNSHTKPICLPQSYSYDDYSAHTAYIAGWGRHDGGVQERKIPLREATLTILSQAYCKFFYKGYELTSKVMCAGNEVSQISVRVS